MGNFLTSCKPVSFSRRTLLHGVTINATFRSSAVEKKGGEVYSGLPTLQQTYAIIRIIQFHLSPSKRPPRPAHNPTTSEGADRTSLDIRHAIATASTNKAYEEQDLFYYGSVPRFKTVNWFLGTRRQWLRESQGTPKSYTVCFITPDPLFFFNYFRISLGIYKIHKVLATLQTCRLCTFFSEVVFQFYATMGMSRSHV